MSSNNKQIVSIPLTGANTGRTTEGTLNGKGEKAVIFSNMDTNKQSEWDPIIEQLVSKNYMLLTYNYLQYEDEQSAILKDIISFTKGLGAKNIVLIGASRGGVASIKAAVPHNDNDRIVGLAALSAPIEHEGIVFYTNDELCEIKIPKLLINSESDDGADDTRHMHELFDDPKEMLFLPGNAHGTELFKEHREILVTKLKRFTVSILGD